jgi:predicted Zn-dependent peptidase
MRSLVISEETFHNQRETVKEERRLRVDNQPYGAAFTDGMTWPYDSADCFPYGHSVIGSMDDLNTATLSDVRTFFDTYYAPNTATLVVTGDFRPLDLRHLVNDYFGALPRHPDPPAVRCGYKLRPGYERRTIVDQRANLPAVLRFYRMPPHRDPDTPALGLLTLILGDGESSRLNVSVVRRDRAALGTQVSMNPYDARRGPGIMLALAIANQGVSALRLDSLVGRQFDSVRTTLVSPQELQKAKTIFRAGFIRERETTSGRAEALHHYDRFHPALAEINTDLDRYLAVTAEDIRRVAVAYLDPANLLTVIVQPGAGGAQ